jgi:TRAP-type C4-dicarboxylate transport system substrate-binding protein
MKIQKKLVCIVLCMSVMVSIGCSRGGSGASASNANEAPKVTFRMSHNAAAGQMIDLGCEILIKALNEKTNGRIEIQVFGNNVLGSEIACRDMLAEGSLDMSIMGSGAMQGWFRATNLPLMLFAFNTPEELAAVWQSPEFGQKYFIEPMLKEHDIRTLDYWRESARQLISKRPVRSLSDFKGLKLRLPSGRSGKEAGWFDLGIMALSLSLDEALTGMQQGVCDAVEMPVDFIYGYRFHDEAKYVTMTNHSFSTRLVLINENQWSKLSAEDQNILADAIKETGIKTNDVRLSADEKIMKEFAASGVEVIEFTAAQLDELRNQVEPRYEININDQWSEEEYKDFLFVMKKIRGK